MEKWVWMVSLPNYAYERFKMNIISFDVDLFSLWWLFENGWKGLKPFPKALTKFMNEKCLSKPPYLIIESYYVTFWTSYDGKWFMTCKKWHRACNLACTTSKS